MAAADHKIGWVAVDWGTTHLRATAVDNRGRVLAQRQSDDGMGRLEPGAFEAALVNLIGDWLDGESLPVICCGMVGSRQGWAEAPYRAVPCTPVGDVPVQAPARDPRLRVWIVPGIRQSTPPDVMRGEETQIAGFLSGAPGFDGVICLPGTHSKWAHISAGEIVSFRTFMTGELFEALSEHTVLRHSVDSSAIQDEPFLGAVDRVLSRPEMLAGDLFTLRAAHLLCDQDATASGSILSGTLIGAELAAARPYWLGQDVVIIGATGLSENYQKALAAQGVDARVVDGDEMTLAGLSMVMSELKETTH